MCLDLSTLMSAFTSSRRVNSWLYFKRVSQAVLSLTSGSVFGVAADFAVLGSLAAILLAIGAYLFSKIEVQP